MKVEAGKRVRVLEGDEVFLEGRVEGATPFGTYIKSPELSNSMLILHALVDDGTYRMEEVHED